MGKIYHLDLQTLLETFEGQTGVLQREFAKGIGSFPGPCLCTVHVEYGRVTQCILLNKKGQQADGSQVLYTLYSFEDWEVTTTPETRQLSPSLSAQPYSTLQPQEPLLEAAASKVQRSSDEQFIPYLITQNAIELLSNWPHKERLLARTILLQINGTRNIVDIRAQLTLSPGIINQTLNQLFQRGIIRFQRRDPS